MNDQHCRESTDSSAEARTFSRRGVLVGGAPVINAFASGCTDGSQDDEPRTTSLALRNLSSSSKEISASVRNTETETVLFERTVTLEPDGRESYGVELEQEQPEVLVRVEADGESDEERSVVGRASGASFSASIEEDGTVDISIGMP